ncbi:trimethyllysine dioxygenase, mitochondrial-like [Contarinia nasturtii]|uniref:trimethyllysine dioxygenase, mitochondrial-like n=1 Tax=Contarinia nasturtii TaxID=265458 RepID=UPI0012D4594D|nr:trimethyllysine dioxygenase, mitochondrial-like [Contarinia nasturtii]
MPHAKDGMLVFHHELLKNPIEVCSFWLRDHCRCADCYFSETFQRNFNISEIPLDIEATNFKTENDVIHVTWSDGHESSYNILDLKDMINPKQVSVSKTLWTSADIMRSDYANVDFNEYQCNNDVSRQLVASLVKFGCAFIKNVPANIESTEIAIKHLFPVQKTLFGEMWSFSDYKEHSDTAYTNFALPAHNDNTYFNDAAGLQVLHCVKRSGSGGESLLVDGFNAIKKLRQQNREAYEYLCRTFIPAEYIEEGFHFKHCAPVINIDPMTNEPYQLRFNMIDRAVFNNIPQTEMMKFYKHYKALAKEIQREENEWRFKLEPGTICIFDNWRLLHGRTEYSGQRQMVGCYVARNEFMSVARRYGMVE